MNKRIEALIKQCTKTYMYYIDGRGNITETYFNKDMFAELIIKECAHIAWLNSTEDNVAHLKIKQHFGIEEKSNENLSQRAK